MRRSFSVRWQPAKWLADPGGKQRSTTIPGPERSGRARVPHSLLPVRFSAFRSTWALEVVGGNVDPDSGAVSVAHETVVVVVGSHSLRPLVQLEAEGTASRLCRSRGHSKEHECERNGDGCN